VSAVLDASALLALLFNEPGAVLRGTFDEDDGVIVVDDDLVMGTAPLVVVSGAVVGVVRGCPAG
jgi:hypothetical protein